MLDTVKNTKYNWVLGTALLTAASGSFAGVPFIDYGTPVINPEQAPYNSIVKVDYRDDKGGGFGCTGTLVAYNKVLTAGHCAVESNWGGTYTLKSKGYTITRAMDGKSYRVVNVESSFAPATLGHDFAVLTINNDDTSVPTVKLANISRDQLLSNPQNLLAAGYGLDLAKWNNNRDPSVLQEGLVVPTSDVYAKQTVQNGNAWLRSQNPDYTGLPYTPNGVFATCSKQSTDHGDSGGPVFYKKNGEYYQVGDTSWGLTLPNLTAYSQCIDATGVDHSNSRISVFTDLTKNSPNRTLLNKYLNGGDYYASAH